MKKINLFILKKSFFTSFLILGSILGSIYFLCWFIFYKLLDGRDIVLTQVPDYSQQALWFFIIQVIIFAPIVETLLFQECVYHVLKQSKWLRKRKMCIIIIGAVFFGLLHFFSLSYIIVTTICGFFFMYAVVIRNNRGGFWMAVLLHAFVNGLAIFLGYFE